MGLNSEESCHRIMGSEEKSRTQETQAIEGRLRTTCANVSSILTLKIHQLLEFITIFVYSKGWNTSFLHSIQSYHKPTHHYHYCTPTNFIWDISEYLEGRISYIIDQDCTTLTTTFFFLISLSIITI
jgi:hypothetical protein